MLQRIEISNFKAIQGKPLILDKLTNVNYLVGKNGSGKSSVLERLWLEYNNPHDLNKFLEVNVRDKHWRAKILEYSSNYGNIFRNIDNTNTKEWQDYFRLKTKDSEIYLDYNSSSPILALGNSQEITSILNTLSSVYSFTSETDSYFEIKEWDEIKTLLPKAIYLVIEKDIEKLFEKIQEEEVEYDDSGLPNTFMPKRRGGLRVSDIANGIRLIITWVRLLRFQCTYINGTRGRFIFLIEEPEIGLHPEFQKFFPEILENILKLANHEIQFLITTHSPFIISAAAGLDNQKVYLLEGGQTRDLQGEKNTPDSQKGYSGGEALMVVNEMLGSGMEDLLGDKIIFCEKSMQKLLTSFSKSQNKNLNSLFINGGDNRLKSDINIYNLMVKRINEYNKSKIRYNAKTYFIVDNKHNFNKDKISEIKSKVSQFIELSKQELEQIYDLNLVNEFLDSKEMKKWDGKSTFKEYLKDKGYDNKIKLGLAEYVGQNISKDNFQELFPEVFNGIFGSEEE